MNRLFVKISAVLLISITILSAQALAVTTISGKCIDIDAKTPVASATVYIDFPGIRYSTDTDSNGNFSIPLNIMQSINASLSAELPLYNNKISNIPLNPNEDVSVTLYMRKVVFDFTLTIYDYKTKKVIDPRTITFANLSDNRLFDIKLDGNTLKIAFNSVKKDVGILILKSPEYAPAAIKLNKKSNNREMSVYLPHLSKEKMYGVITDKAGNALIDAKVILEQTGSEKNAPPKRYYAYTSYAGLYTLDYVVPGKYKCIVSKNGYSTRLFGIIIQPNTVVEYNLELDNAR